MTHRGPRKGRFALAAEEAGFRRLPPLWVHETDLSAIKALAGRYENRITALRRENSPPQEDGA